MGQMSLRSPTTVCQSLIVFIFIWLFASVASAQDFPPGTGWSDPERWTWEEIHAGRIVDFNVREQNFEPLDPRKPDGWGDRRKLSSGFLKEILFREPYRSAIPVEGVRIVGAWLPERVDLSYGRLERQLWLNKCRFERAADLTGVRIEGRFSLEGSAFAGQKADRVSVVLDSAEIHGHVNMARTILAGVDLRNAKIRGQLTLIGATVEGALNMNGLAVGQHLFMNGPNARFHDVDLTSAEITDQLELRGATIEGALNMNGLAVGHLFMGDGARFESVDLTSAEIGGQLDLTGATVEGALNIDSLAVGQHLLMADGRFEQPVSLIFAHIGHNLTLSGAKLTELDLSATRIDGELTLAPEWREGARLTLRNTHVGVLEASMKAAWPEEGKLQLDGFTYDRLGGNEDHFTDSPVRDDIDDYIAWLARDLSYTPQPYAHLAAVLRAAGEPTKANRIRYESRERERAEAWKRGDCFDYAFLEFLKWTIGYGVGLGELWAIVPVLGFTVFGTVVLCLFRQGPENLPAKAIFSLDRLLPIVELDEAHKQDQAALAGVAKYYFYAHKFFGWVLAGFLIAGLAGLTQD
jgi:uncharacterized protein YjbI with pentapeptide repeats